VQRFFDEAEGGERADLLREIETRTSGKRELSFNVFDVLIDVSGQTVTVSDVLEADASETVTLTEFEQRLHTAQD
jgi:hypothetical protein